MFRKSIVPWHDSDAFNVIMAVLLFCIFLFGVVGIRVAAQMPAFHSNIWIPVALDALSGGALCIIAIRLAKRRLGR